MDQAVNVWEQSIPLPVATSGGENLHLEGHLATTGSRQATCTPHRIEALLRRYNKEGITNWNDVLERLRREDPPIAIQRSTLGKYLKACGLGTSRRNIMVEDDMRQVVLSELQKPQSQKRGVRSVWKTLKEAGNHIKRDFVEKVMKEVDPEGFTARAPKWKIAPRANTMASDSAPPVQSADVPSHLDTPHGFAALPSSLSPPEPNPSVIQRQDLGPLEFRFSPATVQLLDEVMNSSPPAYPSSQPGHAEFEESENIMNDVNVHNRHNPARQTTEHNSRETGQTLQRLIHADGIRAREEERTDHRANSIAVDRVETGSHADSYIPQALNAFIAREASEQPQREDESYRLGVRTPHPGFWLAMSKASEEERATQILRLKLKNAVEDLSTHLENWISTQKLNESSVMHYPPVSATQEESGSPHDIRINHDNLDRRYVPDYNVPEDQVTNDALSLALNLQRDLSLPKSASELLRISDQLWAICGRLKDVGIPQVLLSSIMKNHLNILTIIEQVFGRQDWVLRDLWVCATENLDLHWHDRWRAKASAARIAASAACGLHTLHPSDFSRAIHLHYDWLKDQGSHSVLEKEHNNDGLLDSLKLLQHCLRLKPSVVCAQETLRIVSGCVDTYTLGRLKIDWDDFFNNEDSHIWKDILRNDASTRDNALAIITHPAFAEACSSVTLIQADEIDGELSVISDFLRPFQTSRPSRILPALACILPHWSYGMAEVMIKVTKEAHELQLQSAKSGELEALRLYLSVGDYLWSQVSDDSTCWKDMRATTKAMVELLHTFPPLKTYDWVHTEYSESYPKMFLEHVRYFLDRHQNTEALSLGTDVIDYFRPFVATPFILDIHEFLQLMIHVSATQRRLGDFRASLATSCDTVKLSTALQEKGRLGNTKKYTCFRALVCHARCLLDDDASEATEVDDILRRAWHMISWWNYDSYLPRRFAIEFPLFSKNIPIRVLEETITLFMTPYGKTYDSVIPTWLHALFKCTESFEWVGNDDRAWGLLLQAILSIPTSRERALQCAKSSLELMEAYQDKRKKMAGPYEASILASIHGHKYLLAIIIGDVENGTIFLDETVALYRGIFDTEPQMASLPLLGLLEILLKLARNIVEFPHVAITRLQMWKKEVYRGLHSFFDELVQLLRDLQQYVHV